VQGLFNAQGGVPAPVMPRDPADLWGNTFYFAKSAFGDSYGYIWWIPLHNFLLRYVWAALGAEGFAGMMLTLIALFVLLLFYGLFRAVYFAETATTALPAGGAPAPGLGAANSATTLFATPASAPTPPPLFAPTPTPASASPASHAPAATAAANPVIGNRSLGIYHLPDCDWALRVPARQRADFDSPTTALAAGYRPCRVCKP
jgi:hypothetical protein